MVVCVRHCCCLNPLCFSVFIPACSKSFLSLCNQVLALISFQLAGVGVGSGIVVWMDIPRPDGRIPRGEAGEKLPMNSGEGAAAQLSSPQTRL